MALISIQAALGAAVRSVHLDRIQVSDLALASIERELKKYEWIYTTSYDLLLDWAMGLNEFDHFCDCFWSNGSPH